MPFRVKLKGKKETKATPSFASSGYKCTRGFSRKNPQPPVKLRFGVGKKITM
jgi:hypothetical protein